jgi:transposase
MPRPIRILSVSPQQRSELERMLKRPTTPQAMARRAKIILCRASGMSQVDTAAQIGVNFPVVGNWEARFRKAGLAGLNDAKGRGRKPSISPQIKAKILVGATQPPADRLRWSTRSMARANGVSSSTVQRVWHANEIKPHLTRTFKISRDPKFEEKFWDVIGLYLQPPDKALVLCCDEKSQCQALERTQPCLPLGIGHIRTRTHDYIRHGTITLFAALSYLDGKVFSQTATQHTHRQWLGFLKKLDRETPPDLTLHLIVDNYATHKHEAVKKWIERRNVQQRRQHDRPRIVQHFTPTSSSWMNLVERFFRDLSEDAIRNGSFTSVRQLVEAIERYLAAHNKAPRRYVWRAKGQEILDKIHRAKHAIAMQGYNI